MEKIEKLCKLMVPCIIIKHPERHLHQSTKHVMCDFSGNPNERCAVSFPIVFAFLGHLRSKTIKMLFEEVFNCSKEFYDRFSVSKTDPFWELHERKIKWVFIHFHRIFHRELWKWFLTFFIFLFFLSMHKFTTRFIQTKLGLEVASESPMCSWIIVLLTQIVNRFSGSLDDKEDDDDASDWSIYFPDSRDKS